MIECIIYNGYNRPDKVTIKQVIKLGANTSSLTQANLDRFNQRGGCINNQVRQGIDLCENNIGDKLLNVKKRRQKLGIRKHDVLPHDSVTDTCPIAILARAAYQVKKNQS